MESADSNTAATAVMVLFLNSWLGIDFNNAAHRREVRNLVSAHGAWLYEANEFIERVVIESIHALWIQP